MIRCILSGFIPKRRSESLCTGKRLALVYPTLFGPENLPPLEGFCLPMPGGLHPMCQAPKSNWVMLPYWSMPLEPNEIAAAVKK